MSEIMVGTSYLPEEIVNCMFQAESEEGLFDLSVKGLKLYQHIRVWLYYEITKQLGIFTPPQGETVLCNIKKLAYCIRNAVIQNEVWGICNTTVLIIESSRLDANSRKNIYTYLLSTKLEHDHRVLQCSPGKHYGLGVSAKKIYYDYFLIKRKIVTMVTNACLRNGRCDDFRDVSNRISWAINRHLSSSLKLNPFILKHLLSAYYSVKNAIRLLKKITPKLVIVEDAYTHSEIVHASKMLKIPVIELQHGVIYPYHLGYSYPYVKEGNIDIFPDYIFSFGKFWQTAAPYPIDKNNIISTGFPYFEEQRKKYAYCKRNKTQVLFISQNVLGLKLFLIALDVARKMESCTVIFKLHPKQYNNWKVQFKGLVDKMPSNLVVYGIDSPPIYELFATSNVQVGVFSTALYEGLGFGLRTIVCKLPGWKFAEHLIKSNYATLARNSSDVMRLISESKSTKIADDKIFCRNAIKNMNIAIDRILGSVAEKWVN